MRCPHSFSLLDQLRWINLAMGMMASDENIGKNLMADRWERHKFTRRPVAVMSSATVIVWFIRYVQPIMRLRNGLAASWFFALDWFLVVPMQIIMHNKAKFGAVGKLVFKVASSNTIDLLAVVP
jgi:hypothetical protein